MPSDSRPLEERLEAIERRLEAIERQLIEGVPATAAGYEQESETTGPLIEEASIVSIVGLIGRTLIVLGGAFLIRFMTESKMLPQLAGTMLGITYALCWVFLADRAARKDAYESATFHGVSAAMIGFPLLWETTLKFAYLTPLQSAAAVATFTGVALVVAWHREMRGFALVIGAPAALTMLALAFATKTVPPFLSALLLLGLATLVVAYDRKWYLLGTFVAVVVDFGVLVTTVLRLRGPEEGSVVATLGLAFLCLAQVGLGAVYFGTFSFLAFLRNRNLTFLEVAQAIVVLLIGLGGLVGVSVGAPDARTGLGASIAVFAAVCYFGAYHALQHDGGRQRTFVVYSAAAATAALVSVCLTFRGALLPIVLAFGALVCSVTGSRAASVSLGLHGAVYLLAAAYSSGLAWGTTLILSGRGLPPAFWLHPAPWIVFAVSLAVMLMRSQTSDFHFEQSLGRTRLAAALLTSVTLGALVVATAFGFPSEGGQTELAESSILRTAVISLAAVLLAFLSRKERFAQLKWLVIPFLVVAGAKLVAQDVPSGKPSVLFGSLALFGAALIIAPRLLRTRT